MSKNILEALGKIDVALGGNDNDAVNVIDALDQISQGAGSLKTSVDNINGVQMKICGTGEYDAETGIPTVENPEEGTFYLTPAGQQDNNIFNEYYYKDGQWEIFGGASINVNDLFDLSDRMTKGVDDNGNIVDGAIIEGKLSGSLRNKASGNYSHAEGFSAIASGRYSHAECYGTIASGENSHAEGNGTIASNYQSHAEGSYARASGIASHAEGTNTIANHKSQHVFGEFNIADTSENNANNRGNYVEIVGNGTSQSARSNARTLDWSGNEVLAGKLTVGTGPTNNMDVATKQYVDEHASGSGLQNFVDGSVTGSVRGIGTVPESLNYTMGYNAVAEGGGTTASGNNSHAEGSYTVASGTNSHASGFYTVASGDGSYTEGNYIDLSTPQFKVKLTGNANTLTYTYDHLPLFNYIVIDNQYFINNKLITVAALDTKNNTITLDKTLNTSNWTNYTVTIIKATVASGINSHAEGFFTTASGNQSHAEGYGTTASGLQSHAEGDGTTAIGESSHAEGQSTTASGSYSHAEGISAIANHKSQHVFGEYNIEDPSTAAAYTRGNYVEIVGNGTSKSAKSNARTLDWSGNETLSGSLSLASSLTLGKDTADEVTITAAQLNSLIALLNQ